MTNTFSLRPTLRVGLMNDYFSGPIGRYFNKTKSAYLYFSTQGEIVITNSLLEGSGEQSLQQIQINNFVWSNEIGLVISTGCMGLSLAYKRQRGLIQNQPPKPFGNITIFFRLKQRRS